MSALRRVEHHQPNNSLAMAEEVERAVKSAVAQLENEIRGLSDFADGLLVVLANIVPDVLSHRPALAAKLWPHWAMASERFDALEAGGPPLHPEESLDVLEARKVLFRLSNMSSLR